MQQRRSSVSARGSNARIIRRVWLAGIAVGLLVVAGLIRYAAGTGHSSTKQSITRSSSAQQQRLRYGQFNLGIAYGSTRKQVLRQIGSPTAKQGDCWLYRGHVGRIRGRYSGPYVDAMRFCFSDGPAGGQAVTQIFSHSPIHTIIKKDPVTHSISKKTFQARWDIPIDIAPVPDWYLQEGS
jgi:hypothetical protein